MTTSNGNQQKTDRVFIFDTTLRDGEQAPGCSMNLREKLAVANQLHRLGVDIIEAGFPISSDGDFEAVNEIAKQMGNYDNPMTIAGLARAREGDIVRAGEAVKPAKRPRIHTFIATSPIHMEYKLRKSPAQVIEIVTAMVKLARSIVEDVEFSLEDAGRTEFDFMCEVTAAAIEAGATTINVPDTVGYCQPAQYADRIRYLRKHTPGIENIVISTHCHNDLGLAVANSLAAVMEGARQIECTVNGLGERAGNASLEEIAMNFRTRSDFFPMHCNINTAEIYRTSRLVSEMTGQRVQANKAIVGANAFAHESGIHQDGMLKYKETYEIMTPESVGWTGEGMVLGKHSGRHAFNTRIKSLGYNLSDEEAEAAFARFKELCDKKKDVYEDDLIALADEVLFKGSSQTWELVSYEYAAASSGKPSATISLRQNGEEKAATCNGDGPIDAAFTCIDELTEEDIRLVGFVLDAVTEGEDALGRVTVTIEREAGIRVKGRAVSTDVVLAGIKACINALNSLQVQEAHEEARRSGEAVNRGAV